MELRHGCTRQASYRGLMRLAIFLSTATPARRKASASAPPCSDSFRVSDRSRGLSSDRAADVRATPWSRPTSSSRRNVNPIRFRGVTSRTFTLDVPRLHDLARVLHESLCHRRDVDQAILMDPDVDEGAERCDVGNFSLKSFRVRDRSRSILPFLAALKTGPQVASASQFRRMSVTVGKPNLSSTTSLV